MAGALWNRLSRDVRIEVDRLIICGCEIQAIALVRREAGPPTPGIHACVDLLQWRYERLDRPSA